MKSSLTNLILTLLCAIVCTSCERSGYYDSDQKNRLSMLTSVKWTQRWTDRYDPENPIDYYQTWSFDTKGKASFTQIGTDHDGKVILRETQYYDWTFTTENFAVIYLFSGTYGESFWLIEKLTAEKLRVKAANQDPVLYPSVPQTTLTFDAEARQ
ncbi:MAG: hypothetical protein K2F88_05140 [Duncaniella sp.]|uniref:hypothetical protein n=1 Tax=Duncaniella sp. TaxID=2518496 RepID=UPI0023BD7B04|nr:hypothetical protein [Duncaniella sp.]MDE5988388.1 hypothetical protein [Duncaniella sp.]MDE6174932.1 hypothetical protein [Duncaniella sp.]